MLSLNPFLLLFLIILLTILAILYKSKDDVIANTLPLNFNKYGGMEFIDNIPQTFETQLEKTIEPKKVEEITEPKNVVEEITEPKNVVEEITEPPKVEKITEPQKVVVEEIENKVGDISVVYDKKYNTGEKLDYKIAKEQPIVKYSGANISKFYTIMMVDPDVPSYKNPIEKEWRHWVVGNVVGKILLEGLKPNNSDDTNTNVTILTTYNGPMPGVATSWHRYYFKIYEQPKQLPWYPIGGSRNKWKSAEFAAAHNLKKVAQTYFICKRDFDGRKNRAPEILQKIHDLQ